MKIVDHYLDDFVILAPPESEEGERGLRVAVETCKEVGFPVAEEKTRGPATLIELLGIEIDSELMQLRLPPEKLKKLRELVASWRKRKACTKRELAPIIGRAS